MSRTYTRQNILEAIKNAGLRSNDTVFLTTSLGMLGIAENVNSSEELNQLFFGVLSEYFRDSGNVIVPTYSYTFGRSTASKPQLFDPAMTPAEVGPFPEFFRRQPGVSRTMDPMMSVAGFGPLIADLFKDIPPTSYGENSIFARLTKVDAKCCSIGLGPNWMPFIHYADWLCKAPFRYDKLFKGHIKRNGSITDLNWLYTVPLLHPASHSTGHKIAKLAEEAGIWQFSQLGRARVYVADYRRYFDFTIDQLKKDCWMTADGPPADPLKLERERVALNPSPLTFPDISSPKQILQSYAETHRCEVCDYSDQLIEKLCTAWNLQQEYFLTGENHLDWIIPERWQLHRARLSSLDGKDVLPEMELARRICAYSPSRQIRVSHDELLEHVKNAPGKAPYASYHNAVLNRDWVISLSEKEVDILPDADLQVDIQTSFAYDRLAIAASKDVDATRPLLVIAGYINGPAGGKDLISAWAAHSAYKKLSSHSSKTEINYMLLILPGPAGFAAWLSRNAEKRQRILGVIEFCRLQPDEKTELRLPRNFADHKLVKLWDASPSSIKTYRDNKKAYLLTPGENPVARNFMPEYEFPVISIGKTMASEYFSQHDNSDPFEKLCVNDFSELNDKMTWLNHILVSV